MQKRDAGLIDRAQRNHVSTSADLHRGETTLTGRGNIGHHASENLIPLPVRGAKSYAVANV